MNMPSTPTNKKSIILLAIWVIPFFVCIGIVLYWKSWIPDYFSIFLSEVIHTFSPHIAIILAFIFSDSFFRQHKIFSSPLYIIALLLSIVYIALFVFVIFQFHNDAIKASEVISTLQILREGLNFLIAGGLVYLFTSRGQKRVSKEKAKPKRDDKIN